MLFSPDWVKISQGLETLLTTKQIKKLEDVRKKHAIPHNYFSIVVLASSEFGKIIIKRDYENLKKLHPAWSEKELLTFLLHHENKHMKNSGSTEVMSDGQIADAMCNINLLEDFCNFVVGLEHREQPLYYGNEICQEIESIIKTDF
jgi:hypothetical protein